MRNCCNFWCERFAISCKELYQCNPALPSGYYNITTPQGVERVYCDMNTTNCGNITGGWMRAAYIDMTNPGNTCPDNLTFTVQSSTRMCRSSHTTAGCTSVTFPAHNLSYTKVCGRAHGYQYASTDGFASSLHSVQTIEGYYVDGISVTHGSPRNHIWTFAAGLSIPRNTTVLPATAPVPPPPLIQMHRHLWERIFSVSLGCLDHLIAGGTLMTLCGTHRGVQVGAPAVIVVVRGSLPHYLKQPVTTLK